MQLFLIILTIAIILVSHITYIVTIVRGQTKPHIFSWILWFVVNIIAAIIQVQHGAGWGAITLGLSGSICSIIIILSIWYGEKHITTLDTVSFAIALCILPVWLLAKADILAMILAISIDILSIVPTMRKSFQKPHEENIFPYLGTCTTFLISLLLIQEKSVINLLYPIVISCMNFSFVSYILARRRLVK